MALGQAIVDRLDACVRRQMDAHQVPGLVLAVTDREETLHVAAYGYGELAGRKPASEAMLFEIGSISKSFTASALLQLHEEGKVDLHAPVRQYLPWFDVPSEHASITLHHLLSHTAGIISGTDFSGEAPYEVWALRDSEATAPPGTYFHYSNVGYKALGLVLEHTLQQSYPDIIRERILVPLDMSSSEPAITHHMRQRMATGYASQFDDRPRHGSNPLVPATWLETSTADGSIAATAADMSRYVRMLLNRGRGPQGQILAPASFELMTRPHIRQQEERGDGADFYGYGLDVGHAGNLAMIGHTGGMVGYETAMLADLDSGLGVIVLTNGPGDPAAVASCSLQVVRDGCQGSAIGPLPDPPQPTAIGNADEYVGMYQGSDGVFEVEMRKAQLLMLYQDSETELERRGQDLYYVPHQAFSRFLLRFGRDNGEVVEAFHGASWFSHGRYRGPTQFEQHRNWEAYPGHYRSHNPWYSNFRVVLRKGGLYLVEPSGEEETLLPLGPDHFRVGEDPRSPERLSYGTVIGGQAICVNHSGCEYYRTFTP